ncbi:MAG: T9SS type A sorting domain-containing protein [Schleiferiaceae bacterium]|nr:T9SS type A sorting domain-containing protein [Schleiferiaceae bacterium]
MKKILLSLLSILVAFTSQAQSLIIHQADSSVTGSAYWTDDLVSYVQIKNVSNTPLDVKVKRIDGNFNDLTASNAICWTLCYATSVSVSPDHITIQPNEVNTNFSGHVYPPMDGVANSGPITYVFFDMNNPNDSVAITINYNVTQTFSAESISEAKIARVFPNPASEFVYVDLESVHANSQKVITITNMVGAEVRRIQVGQTERAKINVSSLDNGVYFVTLKVNDKAVTTRRVVVAH